MSQKFGVEDLGGVIAVLPTPATPEASSATADFTVDLEESERMVRKLIEDGVDGIMTNGTLGEMATLTAQEWRAFARVVIETVNSVEPDLPLFIGATTLSTRETLERARFVRETGGRGLFLGRPFWNELGPDAMIGYYRDLCEAMPEMSVALYDNPEAFKGPIPTPVYAQLAKIPQIVVVKYMSITPKYRADMEAVGEKIRLLPIESDWLVARSLYPEKASACWSSSALCGPAPVIALRDAFEAGDLDRARWITNRMEWTYEPFLARQNFKEFSRYNIPLEKIRFDEAEYVKAGPSRHPYQVVPGEYAEGARENGRRWKKLAEEVQDAKKEAARSKH